MSIRRIIILLKKEFVIGSKSFIFVWALAVPIILTLIMSLVFGVFLARTPRLGVYVASPSQVLAEAKNTKAISTREYASVEQLKNAVSQGAVDVGVVIPENFDRDVKLGTKTGIEAFIFGQSYARNREIIVTALGNIIRGIASKEIAISVELIKIGDNYAAPLQDRIFPFIVLIAIFFGGVFIPSSSLIQEKNKKTIDALKIVPSRMTEIMLAKILLGGFVALIAGLITLALNNAFGMSPALLILSMTSGVIMATFIGALLGIYLNDFATLLSFWKIGGILLFFPAIIYIFPQIPAFIGKLFPTYYVLEPIIELSKGNTNSGSVWQNLMICFAIDLILGAAVFFQSKRLESQDFPLLEKR
ncbi:MAG: ABC transporter permease [Caldisericaceae bacterium]